MNDERKVYFLEGNIGAGKSTLGSVLRESETFGFIPEPVKQWQETGILEDFYHDMPRWAFTMQINAFLTRAKTWQEILAHTDHNRIVLERSIHADRYIFVKNCYDTGIITEREYAIYCNMWAWLSERYTLTPDAIFYLRTPAQVCYERLKERGRNEERSIPLDYLLQLETLHDEWLLDNPRSIVLDGTRRWTAAEIEDEIAKLVPSVKSP